MESVFDSLFGPNDLEEKSPKIIPNQIDLVEIRENLSDVGGGRGVFALTDIEAGTLIVAEIPSMTWSDGVDFENVNDVVQCIRNILSSEKAHAVTRELHPRMLTGVDPEDVNRAKVFLEKAHIESISSDFNVSSEEVVRIYLTLQHNGFQSGLYGVLTLVNHSCDPNCIKFPSKGAKVASEIWSTRDIACGEEIAISYTEPLEQLSTTTREFLWLHHRFHCICSICAERNKLEDEECDKNEGLSALQSEIGSMEHELQWQSLDDKDRDLVRSLYGMAKHVDVLLQRHFEGEWLAESLSIDQLRLLSRCHKLGTNISAKLLQCLPSVDSDGHPKESAVQKVVLSYLRHALQWRALQARYVGESHPDVATSSLDIANGLRLVAKFCSPKQIRNAFPNERFSLSKSEFESERKRRQAESSRIQRLYSTAVRYPEALFVETVFWNKSVE